MAFHQSLSHVPGESGLATDAPPPQRHRAEEAEAAHYLYGESGSDLDGRARLRGGGEERQALAAQSGNAEEDRSRNDQGGDARERIADETFGRRAENEYRENEHHDLPARCLARGGSRHGLYGAARRPRFPTWWRRRRARSRAT